MTREAHGVGPSAACYGLVVNKMCSRGAASGQAACGLVVLKDGVWQLDVVPLPAHAMRA